MHYTCGQGCTTQSLVEAEIEFIACPRSTNKTTSRILLLILNNALEALHGPGKYYTVHELDSLIGRDRGQ